MGAWCPLGSPCTSVRSGVFLEALGMSCASLMPAATRDPVHGLSHGRVPAAKVLRQAQVQGSAILGGTRLLRGAEKTLWPMLAL